MSVLLHCIVKKENGYWSARCLDFTLYAVGDSLEDVKTKLCVQINEYLYDALEGEDKRFAAELLLRKAPLRDWVTYYIVGALERVVVLRGVVGEIFKPAIPHTPFHHA